MTILNYNQRQLIYAVVDRSVANHVVNDYAFWSGELKADDEKYPNLSFAMDAFVAHNQGLVASTVAENRVLSEIGETKFSRAYYKATYLAAGGIDNKTLKYLTLQALYSKRARTGIGHGGTQREFIR
jgi:hypothetical protein